MTKIQKFLLYSILAGAFLVRIYMLESPIADWHSWRQSDTSAVSGFLVKNNFDVMHPRFYDISNVPSGKDNPQGYRFVEFPVYNIIQAGLYKLLPYYSLEVWGRLVSIFSSLLSLVFIYFLVKKYSGNASAVFSAVFFAFLPFNIYYSRSILPDPTMAMTILGGIYFFDMWLEKEKIKKNSNWLLFIASLVFTSLAFLLKPYAVFFTLPMIYLVIYHLRFNFYKKWQLYIYLILAFIPLLLWRYWMTQYPEGVPANDWLFNGGNIRFKGAFFYWIFAERIGKLILGYWGLIIFGIGILALGRKKILTKNIFLLSFLISSLLYLFVIARGNVQHDYYQILIIPSICIVLGLGSSLLIKLPIEYFYKQIGPIVLTISAIFTFTFGWYFIRDFYNINNPTLITAGQAIDKLIPQNSQIIAIVHGSEGDSTFLYHANRQGWTSFQNSLPVLIEKGADYLIFANPTKEDQNYKKDYKIIKITKDYIIFDLHKK